MDIYQSVLNRVRKTFGYELPDQEVTVSAEKRLLAAAEEGDVTSVKSLLDSDCSVNAFNSQVS